MEDQSLSDIVSEKWIEEMGKMKISSHTMNKLVMDYLVREGYKEAAEKFEKEAQVEVLPKVEKLEQKTEIKNAILNGEIKKAISLINDLCPGLLDENHFLLFNLQLQQLIEFIRLKQSEEAIKFAQENLTVIINDNEKYLEPLERVMSLLVYDDVSNSPFKDLVTVPQRHKVWRAVNKVFMSKQNESQPPKLTELVCILNWSQDQLDKSQVPVGYRKLNLETLALDN